MDTDDDLLRELRGAGLAESHGRFTLEPGVAREKLRRYRFQERHEYVLALLSAAVRSGATRFEVRLGPGETVVHFDGREFPADELERLFDPAARPAVQELAVGLQGAELLEPRWLELDSGPVRLVLGPEESDIRTSPDPVPGTRIRLRESAGLATLRRSFQGAFGTLPEFRLLAERGGFAPLKLKADGQPLNRGVELGESFVRRYVAAPQTELRLPRPLTHTPLTSTAEAEYSAVLGLGRALDTVGVHLVVAGVAYPFPHLATVWPELRGAVAAGGLRLDLSRSGVVQDQAFAALLEGVKEQALEMLQHAARCRRELGRADLQAAVAIARRTAPADGPVLDLLLESLASRTRPYDSGRLDLTLRAVEGLRREGRDEEAGTRLRDLSEGLRLGALQACREGDPAEAALALGALHRVEGAPWDEAVAECRSLLGDDVGAENLWREVLARHPGHPTAVVGLALTMRRRGRPGHRLPQDGTPRGAWLAANTAMARGDLREAAAHYREALVPGPWGLLAYDGLAETLFLKGHRPQAMQALSQALHQRRWLWPLLTRPAEGHDGLLCALLSTAGTVHAPRSRASGLAAAIRLFGFLGGSGLLIRIPDVEIAADAAQALEDLHDEDDDAALRHWRSALARAESALPLVHPVREYLLWRLVHQLRRMRRYEQADACWARCDALARWRWDVPALLGGD